MSLTLSEDVCILYKTYNSYIFGGWANDTHFHQ